MCLIKEFVMVQNYLIDKTVNGIYHLKLNRHMTTQDEAFKEIRAQIEVNVR